jgi:hypothetical protein
MYYLMVYENKKWTRLARGFSTHDLRVILVEFSMNRRESVRAKILMVHQGGKNS